MSNPRYKMTSTSRVSSRIEDIELITSENGLTRRVIRAEVVRNPNDVSQNVKIALVHQRRANAEAPWADLGGKQLNELRGGEAMKIALDTTQTKALYDHLSNLYQIGTGGVRQGMTILEIADEDEVIQTDPNRARIIRKLLAGDHGPEIWDALIEENPALATKMSLARIYQERQAVVLEFRQNITRTDLTEEYWRQFFDSNWWIFGSSYMGRVGERRLNIQSAVDHPLIGEDGYFEIVEIKRPDFPFWKGTQTGEPFKYRGKYLVPHQELQCAITQASNYILEAEAEINSRSWVRAHNNIPPLKPKCLVVHGRSHDWGQPENTACRLLNDSLHGITVITFDHLLTRATQVLEVFNPDSSY